MPRSPRSSLPLGLAVVSLLCTISTAIADDSVAVADGYTQATISGGAILLAGTLQEPNDTAPPQQSRLGAILGAPIVIAGLMTQKVAIPIAVSDGAGAPDWDEDASTSSGSGDPNQSRSLGDANGSVESFDSGSPEMQMCGAGVDVPVLATLALLAVAGAGLPACRRG